MVQWTFPQVQYRQPVVPDVGSHLSGLANHFMKVRQMQQQQAAREQQMEMQNKRMGMAQAAQADSRKFRDRSFDATQQHRAAVLAQNVAARNARANEPPAAIRTFNAVNGLRQKNGKPPLSFGEYKQLGANPMDKRLAEMLGPSGGAPTQPPPATFQQQSDPMQPDQDPNLIRAQVVQQQPAQPAPGPQYGMTAEQRGIARDLLNKRAPGVGDKRFPLAANEMPPMAKPTINAIEKRAFNSSESVSRIGTLEKSYNPVFQTFEGGGKALWLQVKSKAGGRLGKLTPDEQEYVSKYAEFKQNAVVNLNLYIKEITGAQMSEAEAGRLRKGVPDPGDGYFDGNDPDTFKSRMNNSLRLAKLGHARMVYMRKNGLIGDGFIFKHKDKATGRVIGKDSPIGLDQMRGIMRKRHKQLRQEAAQRMRDLPAAQRDQFVIQGMQQEFGI